MPGTHDIDVSLAQRILSLALERGGDHADLYAEHRVAADYLLEDERIKTVGRGIILGVGVRVLRGDATGYAYSEDFSPERMMAAARTAAQIAAGGGYPVPVLVESQPAANYYPVARASLAEVPEEKLALLYRADRAARRADSRIVKVEVSLGEEIREIAVFSADGRAIRDRQPLLRLGVRAIAEAGPRRQLGSTGGGGRVGLGYFAAEHEPESYGREAARIALAMLDAREAPAGEMEVVLGCADSGILLHEAVGHGLEADFNRKQTSNYCGRIGQQVASPLCTVVDDATVLHSRGAINVDDEGNPGRHNVLIENGILRGYMHDRLSSRHFGVNPSGNGRRQSFRHMPLPRMTNTSLLAGSCSPEEIVRSVKKGVYAKRFSGGQVNISNGDFVFSLTEGYLIEDGKVTAPLKGVNLIGNGPEVLCDVSMVAADFAFSDGMWTCGKDGQSVPVGVGTPTVKIDRITVGGTSCG
ncbi:MAG: metallopeptidase TldD-related protein [Pseudomonadota bacterium]